jgi:hypothetical protein
MSKRCLGCCSLWDVAYFWMFDIYDVILEIENYPIERAQNPSLSVSL